jgi:hypothetical protein
MSTTTLQEIYSAINTEGPGSNCESQALALRRYAQQVLGITDHKLLHNLYVETYSMLCSGSSEQLACVKIIE